MITRRAALVGAGALLAAAPAARAQVTGDAALLTRLVEAERLSVAAYAGAAAAGILAEDRAGMVAGISSQEQQHADALAVHLEALGGQVPAAPADPAAADALARGLALEELTGALDREDSFLEWSEALELRTIAMYVDAVRRALDIGLIQTLLSVLGAEAQHLSAVRAALGRPALDGAFEPGA